MTPSPCTKVCTLDERQVCIGCGRSIDEIVEWPQASEPRRRQIADDAARRRAQRDAQGRSL